MNVGSQPDDARPGGSGPDTRRPERKRSGKRSTVLLAAVLAGLAVIAVAAGVLLTRKPPAQPVTSPVSYRFAAHQYHGGLEAVRRWTLGGPNGSLFTETITASSASGKALRVLFKEPIPAAIAADLRTVRFTPAPTRIVSADPVVEWEMRVPAHGTVTVGYQATVAPAGATSARLTRWVTDFNKAAVTVKPGPVKKSRSGSGKGSGKGLGSGKSSGSGNGSGSGTGSGGQVVVPGVSGQAHSRAVAALQNDGLAVNTETTSNCAASSGGLVVGQSPPGGTSVNPGSAVVITVCKPNLVMVPSVIGLTEGDAEATLQNAGLVAAPTVISDCGSGGPGLVVNQDPGGGASVVVGTTVGFQVAVPCPSSPPPIG